MRKLVLFTIAIFLFLQSQGQNVGIGTNTPDTSAIIEMQSTNKGILIPRITEAARLQIGDPAPGMLVFQSNNTANSFKGFYYFEGSDDTWYRIGTSNQIGIGTEKPHPKAILDIQSTSQGVLFPTLTTAQRNAISNPPNGLHIFNADDKCLNYYDAVNNFWSCYCQECKTVAINFTTNQCGVNFYDSIANKPAARYVINVHPGVTISGCATGGDAISFTAMTSSAQITINNYGTIAGAGGKGKNGSIKDPDQTSCFYFPPLPENGGNAILTKTGIVVTVNNYGLLAGGGGGGNSGSNGAGYGGGGGGGAGAIVGTGGSGGGYFTLTGIIPTCTKNYMGMAGNNGTINGGGTGGAGVSGGSAGSNGGGLGAAAPSGALGGNAIKGGAGNSVTNISGGQYFGVVD